MVTQLSELLSVEAASNELLDVGRILKKINSSDLHSVASDVRTDFISACQQLRSSVCKGEKVSSTLLDDMQHFCQKLYPKAPCDTEYDSYVCERVKIGKSNASEREKRFKPVTNSGKVLVYLLEDDSMFAELLSLQLQQFGYEVGIYATVAELALVSKSRKPDVVICDIVLDSGERSTDILHKPAYANALAGVPMIFLSSYDDFQHRLDTVRSGGVSYFQKPADINELSERIDLLTTRRDLEAIKILLVEESKTQTNLITAILNEAGMYVHAINNPPDALEYLEQNKPDLVLLNVNMSVCSGIELATIIRQFDVYLGLPIVYLSTESDVERQLEAMKVGGDDFITRPIKPAHLIATVTTRVTRSRALRGLMMRDSLTGLYNHTTAKEKVEHEISRAKRIGGSLVFAMIDIDHFKSVNDTYGHPTGDRVIKSLSRMLKQRLRATDIVGRYGGEEFCVAMLDTDLDQARRILDEIRESFSSIVHQSDERSFSSTFSCGVAAFPQYRTLSSLNDAADRALYVAKGNGRNQVVIFSEDESVENNSD